MARAGRRFCYMPRNDDNKRRYFFAELRTLVIVILYAFVALEGLNCSKSNQAMPGEKLRAQHTQSGTTPSKPILNTRKDALDHVVPTTNASTSALLSARTVTVDFPFELASASKSYLLLIKPDGRVQIRDTEGRIKHALDTGITSVSDVRAIIGGWVVLGSLRNKVEGNEHGAVVKVGENGQIGPTWSSANMLMSIASAGDKVVTGEIMGPVYSLFNNGSMKSLEVPSEMRGKFIQVAFWGNELVFCIEGERRPATDPFGICQVPGGIRLREIWNTPPIACGEHIIADIQFDGRRTSTWSRVVWSKRDGKELTRKSLKPDPETLACIGDVLVDRTIPGHLLHLPGLELLGKPSCPPKTRYIAVGPDRVWCIKQTGRQQFGL
jgi:hypothetical protein